MYRFRLMYTDGTIVLINAVDRDSAVSRGRKIESSILGRLSALDCIFKYSDNDLR